MSFNFQRVDQVIKNLRGTNGIVSTIDIITAIQGYYRNQSVFPCYSYNALFGKQLKKHSQQLGIRYSGTINSKDSFGNPTTSAVWEII